MMLTMRLSLAPASMLTDEVRGSNKKARSLSAWLRQANRAVVSLLDKATGESAVNTRAGLTPTHPGKRTQLKLAFPLSPRCPVRSRHGADNEHSSLRPTGSYHRGSN
jgi:hypothetical protein